MPGDKLVGVAPNGQAIVLANMYPYPPPSFGMNTEYSDGSGRKQIPGVGWASW
jgi:hypothetical protein